MLDYGRPATLTAVGILIPFLVLALFVASDLSLATTGFPTVPNAVKSYHVLCKSLKYIFSPRKMLFNLYLLSKLRINGVCCPNHDRIPHVCISTRTLSAKSINFLTFYCQNIFCSAWHLYFIHHRAYTLTSYKFQQHCSCYSMHSSIRSCHLSAPVCSNPEQVYSFT